MHYGAYSRARYPIAELAALAKACQLPVIDDIGSGCFYDLARYGLPGEPICEVGLATQKQVAAAGFKHVLRLG